jgi:hypothetical protein
MIQSYLEEILACALYFYLEGMKSLKAKSQSVVETLSSDLSELASVVHTHVSNQVDKVTKKDSNINNNSKDTALDNTTSIVMIVSKRKWRMVLFSHHFRLRCRQLFRRSSPRVL